jgi:membrane-associated phospholipid phosphatase/phosphoglycolate phosphatase-like HAD superfamily hydrolase
VLRHRASTQGPGVTRPPRIVLILAAVLVPLVALAAIALLLRSSTSVGWDHTVLQWMRQHRHHSLTTAVSIFTNAGSFFVVGPVALLVAAALARRRRGRAAAYVAVTAIATVVVNTALKDLFHRHPPAVFVTGVSVSQYSFPSGHTMNATALAVCLTMVLWHTRRRWLVIGAGAVYAIAVGLSRLYLGVHYPTDVLGGWAFSLALALGLAVVFDVNRGWATDAAESAGRRASTTPAGAPAKGGKARTAAPAAVILLDWGNTLMVDGGEFEGPMADWPHVQAVEGAKPALRRLRPGHRLVVATNADDSDGAAVRAALRRAGLDGLIDDVVSSRDIGVRKPTAGFFAAALSQAGGGEDGLRPADAIMVGDSWENDVVGAKTAGLRVVWLNAEGRPQPEAATAAPDAVIASMRALPAAIRDLERGVGVPPST